MNFPRGRGDQKTKHGISGGWGEYGETLWNGKSWGVGGSNWKNPPWGGMDIFWNHTITVRSDDKLRVMINGVSCV